MSMEPMKSKIKGMFTQRGKEDFFVGRGNMNIVEEWEIRPGGMLVQKRTTADSNHNSVPVSNIKVRVKYGSSCHEISISSQASFGELKKMLAEHTGVHPLDQKLIFKKKERNSKAYLDVAGVKDGSKIVLIEDITSRERRCLEMLKSAKIEKGSKSLQQVSSEVDQFGDKVTSLETTTSKGGKVAEKDVDGLTEILMAKLVALDGIFVEGDLKLQKRMQERKVQQYIEALDRLKLNYSTANTSGGKIPLQQQDNSTGKMPIPKQKQSVQSKQQNATMQMPTQKQQRPVLSNSESFVVTSAWETFD
ncbi:hypothetical protein Peur_020243 [Populus x canadensis]|uniref:BAG family molecular chaperone regulator 1-like n=1 Tax=Populus nigra TaxID=3691 RepID=UPI002B264B00|nr:BAG family molecular chaperone regulator 1-like [Populus nigra]